MPADLKARLAAAAADIPPGEHRLYIEGDGEDLWFRVLCSQKGGCKKATHCGGCGRNIADPEPDHKPEDECYDCRGITAAHLKGCPVADADVPLIDGHIVVSVSTVTWDDEGFPTLEFGKSEEGGADVR